MKEAGAEAPTGFGAEGEGHEWELGIGSLIIDLDADIEKTGSGDGLRMKIKRKNGGKAKHEVVMSSAATTTTATAKKTVGTMTEPELFGPCDPGTSVTLDGVVWQETDGGVLVVNVTWREKSYVGTLLDCTRHDWAPPRLCDESHAVDPENPKQRQTGKRSLKVRPKSAARRTANSGFAVPPSPGKQPAAVASATPGRQPALIQCPEPNCNKKYKHINGLKYHQTHAHGDRQPAVAVAVVPAEQVVPPPATEEPPIDQQEPEPSLPQSAEPAEPMDETPTKPPPPPCPSSPAYSDISDANEESEEQAADSPDDLPVDAPPAAAPASTPVTASTTCAPDTKPFSNFSYCSNFRSRDDRPDGPADSQPTPQTSALPFPYPYSYPAAFSLPASPGAGQNGDEGVCPTMETTGPPPAPTSSYFLHSLSFPHFDPMYRMFPDKGPGPTVPPTAGAATAGPAPPNTSTSQETAESNGGSSGGGGGSAGPRSPPTQRHLHTHHHTHVGVPFPPYHPISFPILSNPAPRATK